MKNEKNYVGFRILKVWQILKHFTGIFHQAETLKLGGVYCAQWAKILKKVQFREVSLFASKAKINNFWKKFFKGAATKGPLGLEKKFKKPCWF